MIRLAFLLIAIALVLSLFGVCFDYSLDFYFGKDVAWYIDVVAGIVCSAVSVPAAVIGLVLQGCGVQAPVFDI